MRLDVYNTHMELYPYIKGDYPIIEEMYTATDAFSQEDISCGYIIENRHMYLPRGTNIKKIEDITRCKTRFIRKSDPLENMSRKHYALLEPRDDVQKEAIKFLELPDHQVGINIMTGGGKSYITAAASTNLNERTLIITPNDGLKKQWIKTFHDMFEYQNDEIMNIVGTDIMESIINNDIQTANVYVVNHQTLNRYLGTKGGFALHNFFKALKIGVKVYDESHLNFKNILLIDFFSNTNRTWYLTATFDRSDRTESKCFKRAFSSVLTFGEEESRALVPKHVIYHTVNINSHISFNDRKKVMKYPSMTNSSYGEYCYFTDKNNTMYRTIVEILKKLNGMDGKILILVPLIAAVDKVANDLKNEFPNKSIGRYHSKMDKEEKEESLNKDIIVSTLKSCGTGRDIKGLRAMINTEALASKINAEQMIGRLRPYKDDDGNLKDTFFFDIVDTCIPTANYWFKARFKRIKELVKEVVMLNM